jgi:tRNA(Ile)-lysidine synthase
VSAPDLLEERLTESALAALSAFGAGPVGVAVSGGGDSMALLHLLVRAGVAVQAVTVDHGLRAASAEEAARVGRICAGLGVPHDILRWDHGGTIAGNVMNGARRARYGLISDWARGRVSVVAVGHTADDQAETLLMGLSRVAGLDGLSGMRPAWDEAGVAFVRPLLGASREELRRYLRGLQLQWIEDPSNEDTSFARVRARKALAELAPLGITAEGLALVARNLAAAQAALRAGVAAAAERLVRERAGALVVQRQGFAALEPELRRRLLIAALRWVSSAPYAPRDEAVQRLDQALLAGRDATLWGCRFRIKPDQMVILREARAVAGTVAPIGALWDGRWTISGPARADHEVRALGAAGLQQIKNWRDSGVSRDILLASPGIWQNERLIAAPVVEYSSEYAATLGAGFSLFVLSH